LALALLAEHENRRFRTKREVRAAPNLEDGGCLVQTVRVRHHIATLSALCCLASLAAAPRALAVDSAELYTEKSYNYGRFEARLRFAAGDGVVGSFFLWKDGSEVSGTFWNELDFEKVGADCHLETNAYFGNPAATHVQKPTLATDLCADYHTYAYEWTPDYISWLVDGVEVRRETGPTATAYAENATTGMQIRFNIWPGDATFGGNFSPSILPVRQYVDWVQYSSFKDGAFTLDWRDDFDAAELSSNWLLATWGSPKNLSTHSPANVTLADGSAVLSLTGEAMSSGGAGGTGGATTGGASSAGTTSAGTNAGTSAGTTSTGSGGTGTAGTNAAVGATAGFDNGYRSDSGCALGRGAAGSGLGGAFGVALAMAALGRRRRARPPLP